MNVRINKYLADHGYASRREADVLVEQGKVLINGKKAVLGDKVSETDEVRVEGVEQGKKVYYAYYKPTGIVTVNAQEGEQEILDVTEFPEKVYPVGRLDKESEGLIIFTNDGRVVDALLNPDSQHEKEYSVHVNKDITHIFLRKMQDGIDIGVVGKTRHYKTKPALVRKTGKKTFDIVITEGKNRQIRRMCGALGYKVTSLKRFRITTVELGSLKAKQFKVLKGVELQKFLNSISLT